MKWDYRKSFVIAFFSLFLTFPLFPVSLLLNDGRLYRGQLLAVSNEKVLLKGDHFFFEIENKDIDILINEPSSGYDGQKLLVSLELEKGLVVDGELLRSTAEYIFILTKAEEVVRLFNYNEVLSFYLSGNPGIDVYLEENKENIKKVFITSQTYSIDERFNNLLLSLRLMKKNSDPSSRAESDSPLDIFDPDFYDLFWMQINSYLGPETKEIIWDLIENYYEKEVILFNIYRDEEQGLFYKQEFLKHTRNEFFRRAKKIILTMPE